MSSQALKPLRILVVDSEVMVRHTLRALLEWDRHGVEEAGNGKEALHRLQGALFDVVIISDDLADLKWDLLAAAVKAVARSQRVLLMTTFAGTVRKSLELEADLDGVVEKPFGVEAVREAIARVVGMKHEPPSSTDRTNVGGNCAGLPGGAQ